MIFTFFGDKIDNKVGSTLGSCTFELVCNDTVTQEFFVPSFGWHQCWSVIVFQTYPMDINKAYFNFF